MKKVLTWIVLAIIINLLVLAIGYIKSHKSGVGMTYYGPSGICESKNTDCCVDGELCKVVSKTHDWKYLGLPVFLETTKIDTSERQWTEGEEATANDRYAGWGLAPSSAITETKVDMQYKFNFVNLLLHIVCWFGLSAVIIAALSIFKTKQTKDLTK